jgi:hypothetical protein
LTIEDHVDQEVRAGHPSGPLPHVAPPRQREPGTSHGWLALAGAAVSAVAVVTVVAAACFPYHPAPLAPTRTSFVKLQPADTVLPHANLDP